MGVACFIPIKSNSERVKGKNFRVLNGKKLYEYIIEHSINPLQRKITVLDLAGGRGADELNLYHSGAYSIFAADADKDALVQYVERTPKTPILNHTFLLDTSKNIEHMPKSILINTLKMVST